MSWDFTETHHSGGGPLGSLLRSRGVQASLFKDAQLFNKRHKREENSSLGGHHVLIRALRHKNYHL